MLVADWSGASLRWEQELAALKERLCGAFGRPEVRASAGGFIDGLLSGIARKTGWLMAEARRQRLGLHRPRDAGLRRSSLPRALLHAGPEPGKQRRQRGIREDLETRLRPHPAPPGCSNRPAAAPGLGRRLQREPSAPRLANALTS
jgi:hypothetical protein